NVDVEVEINYFPLTFEVDGKKTITGHKWQGVVKGAVKSADGTVLKEVSIRHQWGTNTKVDRKQGETEFMRQITSFILLDLFELPDFVKLVPEGKKEAMAKELAAHRKTKEAYYDEDWKS